VLLEAILMNAKIISLIKQVKLAIAQVLIIVMDMEIAKIVNVFVIQDGQIMIVQ